MIEQMLGRHHYSPPRWPGNVAMWSAFMHRIERRDCGSEYRRGNYFTRHYPVKQNKGPASAGPCPECGSDDPLIVLALVFARSTRLARACGLALRPRGLSHGTA